MKTRGVGDFQRCQLIHYYGVTKGQMWLSDRAQAHSWLAKGFPRGSVMKNLPSSARVTGDCFHPWAEKIPWSRKWHPTPVSLPGKFHGQWSLVCYSPWCHKESNANEHALMSVGALWLDKYIICGSWWKALPWGPQTWLIMRKVGHGGTSFI